jgi:hypothetical protein
MHEENIKSVKIALVRFLFDRFQEYWGFHFIDKAGKSPLNVDIPVYIEKKMRPKGKTYIKTGKDWSEHQSQPVKS